MNLGEKKDSLIKEYMENNADDAFESGFNDGFDAAISLQLPEKFLRWTLDISFPFDSIIDTLTAEPYYQHKEKLDQVLLTDELYTYWIDNILKV